jgi:two-component system, chemotaxis family, CheB/CheR fusion protein
MSQLLTTEQPINVKTKGPDWTSDEFLALVSHELRNPIAAILGWADAVSAVSVDPKVLVSAIEAIKRSALQGAKLVNDLIDFSRIRNGGLVLDIKEVSVVSILEAAIEMIKPQARAKAIEVETEIPECPTPIAGDAARLQQVFTNILSNAIKFTPAGGRVRVRVECRNQMEIRVSDTGRGISAEFLPFVFDRYRQQVSETAETGGLGLGLAITKYLVEEHGGTIYANSAGSGKGATFTVCLPYGQPELQSPRPSEVKESVWV